MINIGGSDIRKLYVGSTEIAKAYVGSELVYEKSNAPALPYDSEVEWLGSDSNAYIDTLIGGNNYYLRITGHFMYTTHVNYGAIYGNYVADSSNATRMVIGATSNSVLANLNTVCGTNGNTQVTCSINTKHFFLANYNHVIIDSSVTTVSNKTGGTTNSGNICLFNRSLTNTASRNIGLKIYDFQICDNGVLVRDFIPVRVGQVGYMYDKVSGELFGNVGSGSFTFGNDVQRTIPYDAEIEFIQNTASSCIITDYVPTGANIKIQGKFMPINYSAAYSPWFQAYTSESASAYRIVRANQNDASVYFTCGSKASSSGIQSVSLNTIYEFQLTMDTLILNGNSHTYTTRNGTTNTSKFAIFSSTSKSSFTRGKLYYFKVWDVGTVIFDFIPVRVGTVGYLYDKVSGELFGNNGTGSFTLGPDVS